MPTPSSPRSGSKGFSPRKRAASEVPSFRSWPTGSDASPLGYAGYKAGMTHVMMVNDDPGSPREGMTESVPVTILETPPLRIAAARVYRETPYGKRPVTEVWTDTSDPELERRVNVPENHDSDAAEEEAREAVESGDVAEVRAIAYTQPDTVDGVPKKTPDVMEIPLGGSADEAFDASMELLGGEVAVDDVHRAGEYVDVSAVTKGKGTQGPVKRWGVQLRKRKHGRQGWRRRIGNLGPWHPSRVRSTVPQQGQTGYHQRTEENKRLLAVGDEDVTPEGGLVNYGEVDGPYVLVKGSVPGPKKRLVRTRHAVRPKRDARYDPEVRYVSQSSSQG